MTVAASSSVVVCKRSSNKGILNSNLNLICWLNSCLQLLQITSIPMFLLNTKRATIYSRVSSYKA